MMATKISPWQHNGCQIQPKTLMDITSIHHPIAKKFKDLLHFLQVFFIYVNLDHYEYDFIIIFYYIVWSHG
jgi:hypothetical protein